LDKSDRFNYSQPEIARGAEGAELAGQRNLLLTEKLGLISASGVLNPAKIMAGFAFFVAPPISPGDSIRSTPRRPGAPASQLPH
jgi:hypothetical protein